MPLPRLDTIQRLALGDDLLLRRAMPQDTPAIHHLVIEVFGEYGFGLDVNVDKHLDDPASYFDEHGGVLFVIERTENVRADGRGLDEGDSAETIVGTVGYLPMDGGDIELKALYLRKSLRARGLGRRLVTMVLDHARAAGSPRVELWSDTRFAEAHRLYESFGFRNIGKRDLHDQWASWEYGFELRLE